MPKNQDIRTFIHDLSSPILIISLALGELQSYVKECQTDQVPLDPEKILKIIDMLSKNTERASHFIHEFRTLI